MRLRLAVIAGLALAITASASAATNVRITRGTGVAFPARTFIIDLPSGMVLTPYNVAVRENGRVLGDVEVIPGRSTHPGELGAVLVVDASNSMRGAPSRGALAAARAFVTNRAEQELLGIVRFNSTANVTLGLTTDGQSMNTALASPPPLAYGTHIYDAVDTALNLLRQQRVVAGSVVLLSDGSDTGSKLSAEKIAARARQAGVRIFTVGLHSKQFKPKNLQTLAESTGGTYTEAVTPEELKPIYANLSARLASEYLIHYTSAADPGEQVHVAIAIDGLDDVATTVYGAPALEGAGSKPLYRSISARFWRSFGAAILTALLVAMLLGFALVAVVRRPAGTLRRRMAEFVGVSTEEEQQSGRASLMSTRMFAEAERSLAGRQWWTRFKDKLVLAEIETPAVHLVVGTLIGAVMVGWLFALFTGTPLALLVGVIVPLGVNAIINRRVRKKRALFAEQLPDNLQVLASALRAGHSLVGALSVVVEDAAEPTRSEFRRVIADEQLGVQLEDALDVVVQRMESKELGQVALVASLQRRTGGNSAEVLDRVVETIRERAELRRLVRTLTTQGRMSRWIVSLLPVVLLLAITAINPNYVQPLFATTGGRIALSIAGLMIVAGSMVIQRIVDIKV